MPRDPRKYLYDIDKAAALVADFTRELTFDAYLHNAMARAAVERQFEVIGEALSQLAKAEPEIAAKIPEYRAIIAFRNLLIHGYADVDDRLVWGIIEGKLSPLRAVVHALLV